MLFNSIAFPLFLLAAATAHALCPPRARGASLLLASYGFYCLWSLPHALLLLAATGVAFLFARRIAATEIESSRQRNVAAAVMLLLGSLAVFKYLGAAGQTLGLGGALAFAVPVGISYYTFKLISYVVDVHWGKIRTEHDFFALARYAAFFPQILCGPIQRAEDYLSQEKEHRAPDVGLATTGLRLMLFGFFKKLVIADNLAVLVDQVYAGPEKFPSATVTLAVYLYAIQLYSDFSGLTDIAIGAGCLFGIRAPKNFDAPFYAPNSQEFWRRWHMSLTSWITDYLFTPLRMALRDWGAAGLVICIVFNMLAIGIWHSPHWTFVLFGAIVAFFMVISTFTLTRRNRFFARRPRLALIRRVTGPLGVFHLMVVAFIVFRATSIGQAFFVFGEFVRGLGQLPAALAGTHWGPVAGWSALQSAVIVVCVAGMETGHYLQRRTGPPSLLFMPPRWVRWGAYYSMLAAIVFFGRLDSQAFIYFNF